MRLSEKSSNLELEIQEKVQTIQKMEDKYE